MSITDIRKAMLESGNDIYFVCDGRRCGIESEFDNGVPTFVAWCGPLTKQYNNFEDMITDKIFNNKSLLELSVTTKFDFL